MVVILHADVEAEFIGYLTSALQARPEPYASQVSVRNRVPDERAGGTPWPASGRLIVVRDDGGPTTPDIRATARIGVRVWGPTEAETADLALLASALVGAWRSPTVRASRPTRPYSVIEESGRAARYFTAELMIRGRAA